MPSFRRRGTQRTRRALAALVRRQRIDAVVQIGSMILIIGSPTSFVLHASNAVYGEQAIRERGRRPEVPSWVRAKAQLHARERRRATMAARA